MKLHSHTLLLTSQQAAKLREILQERGFDFETKPYTIFSAKKDRLNVAVYENGPKLLLQGRGIEDFITFILEPEVTGQALLGYDEVHAPELFEPHFGVDESGKGDFFGPLVIAGVYTDQKIAKKFQELGICDSKGIGSDKKIRELAAAIKISQAPWDRIVITPQKYNQLYNKIGNLNTLLAWGHARVLENLCVKVPSCPRALSDKFANERVLQRALLEKGKKLQLTQRTKAESDYAVAAASILAREGFIDWLEERGKEFNIILGRGVSAKVKATARELFQSHGAEILPTVAKMHFKTAVEVISK